MNLWIKLKNETSHGYVKNYLCKMIVFSFRNRISERSVLFHCDKRWKGSSSLKKVATMKRKNWPLFCTVVGFMSTKKMNRERYRRKGLKARWVGYRKNVKRYGGFVHTKDERYLKIPFEEDEESYLSRLPREVFMNVFYKACAGEQEEYRRLLYKEIRGLKVCPNLGWVRFVHVLIQPQLPFKSPYPPQWKPVENKRFRMIYKMLNAQRCTTKCSHYHRVIDHHLSVGLSSAAYRLLNPPLGEEASPEIRRVRMKNIMDEGFDRICRFRFLITQKKMTVGKRNVKRMGYVNPTICSLYDLLHRIFEQTAIFYDRARTYKLNPVDFCSCWDVVVWICIIWRKRHWGREMFPLMWSFLSLLWKQLHVSVECDYANVMTFLLFSSRWRIMDVWTDGRTAAAGTENSFYETFQLLCLPWTIWLFHVLCVLDSDWIEFCIRIK